jgi:hypothetical protein
VRVAFSSPLAPSSVRAGVVRLVSSAGDPVATSTAYDAATRSVVLTPSAPLLAGGSYTVRVTAGSGGVRDTGGRTVAAATSASFVVTPALAGASDIADCTTPGTAATAALLEHFNGTVFTAGDNAYPSGSVHDFATCYGPTWGMQLSRTRPAAGNHDYVTRGATGYFSYFGAAAGPSGRGYYSYDLGAWHVVVLDTNNVCLLVKCDATSAQVKWLRADLAASTAPCTVAIWHHPRFSSGFHGSSTTYAPFWNALYQYGAEIVVNGHDRDYQRFAQQTPTGMADPTYGIREFVVGTGGVGHDRLKTPRIRNTEASNDKTFGVIELTLHASSYQWRFVPIAGSTYTDSGTGHCHGRPGTPAITVTHEPGAAPVGASGALVAWTTTGATLTTCTLDGRAVPPCTSPLRLRGLKPGRHVLLLHAIGPKGTSDAEVDFSVLALPKVTLTARPRRATLAHNVRFAWRTSGVVAKVRCRLDTGPLHRCARAWRLRGLRDGAHVVRIRVTNAAGTRTLAYGFVVGGAPWLHLTARPAAAAGRTALFRWQVAGATGRAMCTLDGRRPRRCVRSVIYGNLATGRHTWTLRVPGRNGRVGTIRIRWRVVTHPLA